jgi:hypothetical protein
VLSGRSEPELSRAGEVSYSQKNSGTYNQIQWEALATCLSSDKGEISGFSGDSSTTFNLCKRAYVTIGY